MSGLLSNSLGVPLFLTRVFHLKELHMLNRGHRNGLSSCGFGGRLGCHLGSTFGCTLGRFGTRFGSFGGRSGRGHQPLWQAICLRTIAGEIQFSVGKNICQTICTRSTLCPHNRTVRRLVFTVFCNTTVLRDHYQQMSTMAHQTLP